MVTGLKTCKPFVGDGELHFSCKRSVNWFSELYNGDNIHEKVNCNINTSGWIDSGTQASADTLLGVYAGTNVYMSTDGGISDGNILDFDYNKEQQ